MNGVGLLESDELFDSDESDELFESDESDERWPWQRPRPAVIAPGGTPFTPLPPPAAATAPVTQAQLRAELARVNRRLTTNTAAIRRVDTTAQTALRREVGIRRRAVDGLRRDLDQTRQLAAILPLLSRPQTRTLTADVGGGLAQGDRVVVESSDSLSSILPLLLLSGSSSSSSSGSGGGAFGGRRRASGSLVRC